MCGPEVVEIDRGEPVRQVDVMVVNGILMVREESPLGGVSVTWISRERWREADQLAEESGMPLEKAIIQVASRIN